MSTLTLLLFLAGCSGTAESPAPEPAPAAVPPAPAPEPTVEPSRLAPVVGTEETWTLPEEQADDQLVVEGQFGLQATDEQPAVVVRMVKRFHQKNATGGRLHNGVQSIDLDGRVRSADGSWGDWKRLEGPARRDGIRTRNAKRVFQAARQADGRVYLLANRMGEPTTAWTFDGEAFAEAPVPTELGSLPTADTHLIAHEGTLLAAWSDYRKDGDAPGRHLTVARLAEGAWSRVGQDFVAESDGVRDLALSVEGGQLWLGWNDMGPDGSAGQARRRALTDGAWVVAD